jgi:predicted metal-dependent HD superfamily phosphohydrolase
MNDSLEQTLSEARNYVSELYRNKVNSKFVFHDLEHTENVAEACSQMADLYQLNETERFVLMIAAWFHDTGYVEGEAGGHEEASVRLATEFLTNEGIDEDTIQRIASCIRATKMPQSPVKQVEMILCDADLFHLATEDFKARSQLLKQEQENILGHKIDKKDWRKNNIAFLENHKYFTDYGQNELEPKKLENLLSIKKKKATKKEEKEIEEEEMFPYVYEPSPFEATSEKELKEQQKNTERGIQTMFRTTSSNHFELSSLADSKSNIMISVNAIIISVSLTVLLARLAFYPEYVMPTILLLAVCLSSIIFAILATRPSINKGRFTEEDIRGKKTNLLFFGNFHRMKLEEYNWAMNEMLKDREYLYNSMIKDIYFLGVVLARKYKFLRISYTIFMWGLIAAVVAFAIAAVYGGIGTSGATSTPKIDY